jgi:FKBP-type peptidyl-prolyl cis-trans isomerase
VPKDRTTATITIVAVIAIIIMAVAIITVPSATSLVTPAPQPTSAVAADGTAEGEAFLASNATAEGVQTTASGLQYKVVTEGTGGRPTAADTVTVMYEGTFIDGTVFDTSYDDNQPITFALGRVIPGWTEGLQLMSVGSTYMLYIPSDLAYGPGGRPGIPPNTTLIFKVELLDIPSQADATEAATSEVEATDEPAEATTVPDTAPEVTAEATVDS